jgi:hypothetical protein
MSQKLTFENMTDDMLSALIDWRERHGRSWKTDLWAAWMNGSDASDPRGSSLRAIRNQLGPSWLDNLRPKDLVAEAASRGVSAEQSGNDPAL